MTGVAPADHPKSRRLSIPHSRGALIGALLVLLGSWGVLIPFLGQEFGLSYTAAAQWDWTAARGWLQVVPGFVVIGGGMVLVLSRNRLTAALGAWLGVLGGAWFVVGRAVAEPLGVSYAGPSTAALWTEIAYFTGLGAVIMFVAALMLGRLSVRSTRDIRYADSTSTDKDVRPLKDGEAHHRRRYWMDIFRRGHATPSQ